MLPAAERPASASASVSLASRSALLAALAKMTPIGLPELRQAGLLDRLDTKFVVPESALPAILDGVHHGYQLLAIDGHHLFDYTTRYFDTPALRCFRDHVVGRPVRSKIRCRGYAQTAEWWMEIKQRVASGRTVKHRVPVTGPAATAAALRGELAPFLPSGVTATDLVPILEVHYQRCTLVARDGSERVTIDRALHWRGTAHTVEGVALSDAATDGGIVNLAVIELKQSTRRHSPMRQRLHSDARRPVSISKYCLGLAALRPELPAGTSRRLLHRLQSGDLQ